MVHKYLNTNLVKDIVGSEFLHGKDLCLFILARPQITLHLI